MNAGEVTILWSESIITSETSASKEAQKQSQAKAQLSAAKGEAKASVKAQAKAKKVAAAKAESKRLRSGGYQRTKNGYVFPEVSPEQIELASKRKLLRKK